MRGIATTAKAWTPQGLRVSCNLEGRTGRGSLAGGKSLTGLPFTICSHTRQTNCLLLRSSGSHLPRRARPRPRAFPGRV